MKSSSKAMLESYARNLLGQIIGAITIVMAAEGLSTPIEFGQHEWLLVANAIWASLVPVAIRYANKKDAAFGRFATIAIAEVTKKIEAEAKKPAKKTSSKKK